MAAIPDVETIRRKAIEVVARPEYDLTGAREDPTLSLWYRFILWILKPVIWFLESLSGVPWPLKIVIVSALVLLLIALVVHLTYTFMRAIQGPARRRQTFVVEPPPSPEALEAASARRAGEGDYLGAIRYLFKAALVRIETAEEKPFRRGITNREILKRYRSSRLFEPLSSVVELIDTRWYGDVPCDRVDFLTCESEYARIRSVVEGRRHAVSP